MAITKNGIIGGFSGKVGTVIGYELGGQQVMRSVGRRRKPFTALELLNQAKMRAVSQFLSPIKPYIKMGYQSLVDKGSKVGAFQMAQSYIRKHAIAYDEAEQPYVDPAKVLMFRGTLDVPINCRVERDGNVITTRWDNADDAGHCHVMILIYDQENVRLLKELGAPKREQIDIWETKFLEFATRPVHVYAAFRDVLLGGFSDSVYCGAI